MKYLSKFITYMSFSCIILNIVGCATSRVNDVYFSDISKQSQYTQIKKIKWAKEHNNTVYICIFGEITIDPSSDNKYTPISRPSKTGSKFPYFEDTKNSYMVTINRESLSYIKEKSSDPSIELSPSIIARECNEKVQGSTIDVHNLYTPSYTTLNYRSWIETNKPDRNFIYNYIRTNKDWFEDKPFISVYVHMDDKTITKDYTNSKDYIHYPTRNLKIKAKVVSDGSQKVTGVLLYPFAIAFDVITSPIQLIIFLVASTAIGLGGGG